MRTLHTSLVLLALATTTLIGCAPPQREPVVTAPTQTILPLRSLRLYETGVGYFERAGTLDVRATTSLPVPAGHLDDALASLVVLNSKAGGSVTGISFASSVTKATARSRAGLPADPDSQIAFRNLLGSMKGEKVAILSRDAKELLVGRVVEVGMELDEARARALAEIGAAKQDEPPQHLVVTLLTGIGAVTLVPAQSIANIRPLDPAFAARLDAALDALGTRSAQNARALRLLGDAQGPVTFGYVAETPIWRASYRLILDSHTDSDTSPATLQGWALLHNDTDENWHNVHLELVNGEPDSFVFPMAAPRYARRPLVHPDEPLSTLPQLQDTTADALWGDHLDPYGHGSGTAYGQGFGSGHGHLGGSHACRAPCMRMGSTSVDGRTSTSALLDVGNLADLVPASGVEQGALFVYAVPGGLAIEAHASALVPFLQRSVSVESVAFFAEPGATGRAAVRFVNTTGQTLPTGTVAVFGAGGFAGETSLDRLKPGERRLLQIGNDLDAQLTRKKAQQREESKRLTFDNDEVSEHFLRTTDETWELENRGGATRTFYAILAADRNAKVTGVDRVDFDEAARQPVVVFNVKAKEKATRSFTVVEGLSRGFSLDNLNEKTLRALTQKPTIPASELAVLEQALPRVRALEAERAEVDAADRATSVAQEDLERLREDLKALGGGNATGAGGGAAAPLVKRVVEAEDRVGLARKSKEAAEKTLGNRRDALRESLRKLAPRPPE
jgi:hypothetical protein